MRLRSALGPQQQPAASHASLVDPSAGSSVQCASRCACLHACMSSLLNLVGAGSMHGSRADQDGCQLCCLVKGGLCCWPTHRSKFLVSLSGDRRWSWWAPQGEPSRV